MDAGEQTLSALLAGHARDGRLALYDREAAVSYAALRDESRRLAAGLGGLGVRTGDRVAIWMPNGRAWLACLFACAQLGAIAVALNPRFRAAEVGDIIGRTGAKAVVLRPNVDGVDMLEVLGGCAAGQLAGLRWIVTVGDGGPTRGPADMVAYSALLEAAPLASEVGTAASPCLIFTTSGTTKAPKFVLHDQRRVICHGRDVAAAAGLGADGVMLQVPPLCGTFGISSAFAALAAGAPLVLMPRWDPAEAMRLANMHGVTHAMATDDAVAQMLAATDAPRPLPTARYVGLAGVNPALGDIYARGAARGLLLVGLYGSSEVQAIVSLQRADAPQADREERGGFLVNPRARVRACDPATGQVLPHGEFGELEFLVPDSGMLGYFQNPADTEAAFRPDGYFRSGDLGFTKADGRFVFSARIGDSLRLSGFLVNPAEIEQVIEEVDGVGQAQVVGVSVSAALRPVAFVIPAAGRTVDAAAIQAHCGARLAKFKVPVRVFPIDAFPVTVSANATKIQKGKLRDLATALIADAVKS